MKIINISFFLFLIIANAFAIIQIEERQMLLSNYPCVKCHESIKNETPKFPLKAPHERMEFKHMDSINNCYTCHDKDNREQIKLNSGQKVDFNQAYKVCFDCHGEKKRDWENGTHGKQIGSWNGDKFKFVCTTCHEAHSPKFPLMKADPGAKHPRGETPHKGTH